MPLPNTAGMFAYCQSCYKEFSLGSLNARQIGIVDEIDFKGINDIGWICRCDHCGREHKYYRLAFFRK